MRVFFPGGSGGAAAAEIWHTKLRAGAAFSLGHDLGTVAGSYSWVQLLNPALSGVTAVVYAVMGHAQGPTIIDLREYDTAATNLVGVGQNCLRGGAAGECIIILAQPIATPIGGNFWWYEE